MCFQIPSSLYFIHYTLGIKIRDTTHFKFMDKTYKKRQISPIKGLRYLEGSRKLRFPDYVTLAQDGGKVVSLTHRPLSPPGNTPGTHFC